MKTRTSTSVFFVVIFSLASLCVSRLRPPLPLIKADTQTPETLCAPPIYFIPMVSADYREPPQGDIWETEPNTEYWQADGPIVSNRNNYGYPNDAKDYWILYLPSPGKVTLDLTNVSAPSQLQLFYGTPSEVTRIAYVPNPPYHIEHTGASGLYYIMVGVTSGFNSSYLYTLRAQFPSLNNRSFTAAPFARDYLDQWVGYTFDDSTEKWGTSEGNFKLATLEVSQEKVCKGRQALKLTTELRNDRDDSLYLDTEAVGYFDNAVPQGMDQPGPYDLTGKSVSCYVYVPEELATGEPAQAYFQIMVKDEPPHFRNQYSARMYMTEDMADTWQQVALIVGERDDGHLDQGFDTSNVNALGIVVGIVDWSAIRFSGPIYVDHCEIEYP